MAHKIKRPENATLLFKNNAMKARPMCVEELILSGNYKKRLDPNEMEIHTDTLISNTMNTTSPFKSPKVEEADEPIELDEKAEMKVAEDSGVADMPVSREDKIRNV